MKRLAVTLLLAALLAGSGCTAQSSAPPPDSESGVHADWSALTPYQTPQNQYTRRYPGWTEELIPADGYGNLIPFPGGAAYSEWEGDTWLYGLVTAQGEIVVDPVYSSAWQICIYDDTRRQTRYLPYLQLVKPSGAAEGEAPLDAEGQAPLDITIAALDGSWCRSGYSLFFGWSAGCLAALTQDGQLQVLNEDGSVRWSKSAEALSFHPGTTLLDTPYMLSGGVLCYWDWEDDYNDTRYYLLDLRDGSFCNAAEQGLKEISLYNDTGAVAAQEHNGTTLYGYIDRKGAWILEPQYLRANAFSGSYAVVQLKTGEYAVIDQAGDVRLTCGEGELFCSDNGEGDRVYLNVRKAGSLDLAQYRSYQQYEVLAAYDADLQPIDTPAAGTQIVWNWDGSYWQLNDSVMTFGIGSRQVQLSVPEETFPSGVVWAGDWFTVDWEAREGGGYHSVLYDCDGTPLTEADAYRSVVQNWDRWTGDPYFVAWLPDGQSCVFLDEKGKVVSSTGTGFHLLRCGGMTLERDNSSVTLTDSGGKTVFCYLDFADDI